MEKKPEEISYILDLSVQQDIFISLKSLKVNRIKMASEIREQKILSKKMDLKKREPVTFGFQ